MKVLTEQNIADIKSKIPNSQAGVPIVKVDLTDTTLRCIDGTDLTNATAFILNSANENAPYLILYPDKTYTITNTGTDDLTIEWGPEDGVKKGIYAEKAICTKNGTKATLIVEENPTLPVYDTTLVDNTYRLTGTRYNTLPSSAGLDGFSFLFKTTQEASSSSGLNVGIVYGTTDHQHQLYVTNGATGEQVKVTKLLANHVYQCTMCDQFGESVALLQGMVPGDTPGWYEGNRSTTYGWTGTTQNTVLNLPYNTTARVFIDFEWDSATTGELSIYLGNNAQSRSTVSGYEVYTNNTTRSAVKRTNWPIGGKITGIVRHDNIHIELEISPAVGYTSGFGDYTSGYKIKSKFYRLGTSFYEGTFYGDAYASLGGAPSNLILVTNTSPNSDPLRIEVVYLK